MKNAKPDYGYTAIKPFVIIGCIGLLGLTGAIIGYKSEGIISLVLKIICLPVAFTGIYVSLAYIPLYNIVIKPRKGDNFWETVLKKENLKVNAKALDVGCGTVQVSIEISKYLKSGHVTGIDVFRGMSGNSPEQPVRNAKIEGLINRVEFKYGNLLEIPFPDNTFDLVTAGSVLHEVEGRDNKLKALGEIYRVLKPGGKFITVEILRNFRLIIAVLVFIFVWKTDTYWKYLFNETEFSRTYSDYKIRFLKFGIYILQK